MSDDAGCGRRRFLGRTVVTVLAGFDWGARTANCVAVGWPERYTAIVSVSGYLIGSQAANKAPLSMNPTAAAR